MCALLLRPVSSMHKYEYFYEKIEAVFFSMFLSAIHAAGMGAAKHTGSS